LANTLAAEFDQEQSKPVSGARVIRASY
jgi:hypothetical protein